MTKLLTIPKICVVLCDHVLADLELADVVGVTHAAGRIGTAGGVGRITWIANRHKIHGELISTRAEGDCSGIARGSYADNSIYSACSNV